MKKCFAALVVLIVASALLCGCGTPAKKTPPDLSWWPSQSTPQPVKDPTRPGHWWWPKQSATDNAGDKDEWGNRGWVYVNKGDAAAMEKLLLQDVNFEYNKAVITDSGKKVLEEVAAIMKRNPGFFLSVDGHTCSIGGEQYNYDLGLHRAQAAHDALVGLGIESGRMKVQSFGKTRLKVKEKDSPDFALNRRVEFHVIDQSEMK